MHQVSEQILGMSIFINIRPFTTSSTCSTSSTRSKCIVWIIWSLTYVTHGTFNKENWSEGYLQNLKPFLFLHQHILSNIFIALTHRLMNNDS